MRYCRLHSCSLLQSAHKMCKVVGLVLAPAAAKTEKRKMVKMFKTVNRSIEVMTVLLTTLFRMHKYELVEGLLYLPEQVLQCSPLSKLLEHFFV